MRCLPAAHTVLLLVLPVAILFPAEGRGSLHPASDDGSDPQGVQMVLEDLIRDQWKGSPTGEELGTLPPTTDELRLEKDAGWLYTRGTFYNYVLRYDLELSDGGRQRLYFRTLSFPKMAYELRFERRGGKVKGEVVARRKNMDDAIVRIANDRLRSAFASRESHAIELRCIDDVLLLFINDAPVLSVKPLDALGGSIGFGGERVAYRHARLTTLPMPETPPEFLTAHNPAEEGLVMPTLVKVVKPIMPAKAATGHLDYTVWLEAVIDSTGHIVATRFLRRLDESAGYNDEALRVVKQWLFTPAMLDNKPVPITATIEVTFEWR
jgi:hypothetical protein